MTDSENLVPNSNKEGLMQTTCTECNSVFQLNLPQLLAADGRVRCSQCNQVFDANINLIKNKPEPILESNEYTATETDTVDSITESLEDNLETVSLSEAMYEGQESKSISKDFSKLLWPLGILILLSLILVQWIYFDRFQLIKNPEKQNVVLSLCRILPCETSQFKNLQQFKLIERNIFTHPTQPNALLISGSFVNEAPFTQAPPSLKVSLFNISGEVTAQRLFSSNEYSANTLELDSIAPGERIHFQLEIIDPNTVTITYEFEFI